MGSTLANRLAGSSLSPSSGEHAWEIQEERGRGRERVSWRGRGKDWLTLGRQGGDALVPRPRSRGC
jgi:hypothetical protein